MAVATNKNPVSILMVVVLVALAFAGGYYYYQQKDKDTILDVNIGGKQITAEVERE
jgi:hypothetical protein